MTYSKIPSVVILGHLRFTKIINLLLILTEISNLKIYISIDGPKNLGEAEIQLAGIESIHNFIAEKKVENVFLQKSDVNRGVSAGVIYGIDWFFKNENFGAILEEDILIDNSFLDHIRMNYKYLIEDSKCLFLSASQFFEEILPTTERTKSSYPLIWGWATTDEKWKVMKSLITLEKINRGFRYGLISRFYWAAGRFRVKNFLVDSWAIPLADAMHHLEYFCLLPQWNLSTNIGDDEYAIHTRKIPTNLKVSISKREILDYKEIHSMKVDKVDKMIEKHVYKIRKRHLLAYVNAIFDKFVDNYF